MEKKENAIKHVYISIKEERFRPRPVDLRITRKPKERPNL